MQMYNGMSKEFNAVTAFKKCIFNNYKCKLAISGLCVADPCLGSGDFLN